MAAAKLTDEQITQALDWREAGRSVQWIASRLKVSRSTVAWHLLKTATDAPQTAGGRTNAKGPPPGSVTLRRDGIEVRRFTAEEDAAILAMRQQGLGARRIGNALTPPRPQGSITYRLLTLARREARAEAHDA
jgi:transcriptional regulator